MTDISPVLRKIQVEETDFDSAVSENLLTSMGAAVNWIIENTGDQVGDVRTSLLSEADFQTLRNSKWVLMDGRSVAGSDYETLTGNSNIPDARATWLRSKDNGRGLDSTGDPALGSFQGDAVGNHKHKIAQEGTTGATNELEAGSTNQTLGTIYGGSVGPYSLRHRGDGVQNAGDTGNPTTGGAAENRVKSTIVNYFIKINN